MTRHGCPVALDGLELVGLGVITSDFRDHVLGFKCSTQTSLQTATETMDLNMHRREKAGIMSDLGPRRAGPTFTGHGFLENHLDALHMLTVPHGLQLLPVHKPANDRGNNE